jgi:16S rRNA (cytosine967-C5)-methyltransferase
LAPDEAQRFAALPALSGAAVLADRASFPAWLTPEIERQFGADAAAEMAALTAAAPTDLRANGLKATREDAAAALAAEGVATTPTPLSPLGLRLATRANLAGLRAFRDGLVEVQDEASQLVALMAGAAPGMAVLDLCAGAGGKTLALAAAMRNRGRLLACDTDARRLARLGPRLARSGAAIVETRALRGGENLGGFDRVLVDAPCSGSGTWRRHPDAKWRLTPERLDTYRAAQAALLREGAARVKQGGRLVFATCSLLPSEGRGRIEAFLAEAGGTFRIVDALPALGPAPYLLTPHRHGTDGFFAAVLERRA